MRCLKLCKGLEPLKNTFKRDKPSFNRYVIYGRCYFTTKLFPHINVGKHIVIPKSINSTNCIKHSFKCLNKPHVTWTIFIQLNNKSHQKKNYQQVSFCWGNYKLLYFSSLTSFAINSIYLKCNKNFSFYLTFSFIPWSTFAGISYSHWNKSALTASLLGLSRL